MDLKTMMKELGIDVLTGESDATKSGRLLCDIPKALMPDIEEFFGLTTMGAPAGWNNKEKESMMLTRQILQQVVKYLARKHGFWVIESDSRHMSGYPAFVSEEMAQRYKESADDLSENIYVIPPIKGKTRNQHMFSGRVV